MKPIVKIEQDQPQAAQNVILGRRLRNAKDFLRFPFWLAAGKPPPDHHFYKVRRIRSYGRQFMCQTVIETGTFFGQTVAALRNDFDLVFSVELSGVLYRGNAEAFRNDRNVRIFSGDSSTMLAQMIDQSAGRIIYWLDGHFSGGRTACGDEVTPILRELAIIREKGRRDDCVLIDDARLFTGKGYPTKERVFEEIRRINDKYSVIIDRDCIVAYIPKLDSCT